MLSIYNLNKRGELFRGNQLDQVFDFQFFENNQWELILDSYGDVLGPISWEKTGSVWVEGCSAKVLKTQSR